MKIRYVIPGAMSKSRLGAAELARRDGLLKSWAAPGTEVEAVDVLTGPASIESAYELSLCVPGLVDALLAAEQDGVDAIIIGCFDDPGIEALREIAQTVVVVGPAGASIRTANLLGDRYGIVTPPEPGPLRHLVAAQGLGTHLAGIELVHTSVLAMRDDPEDTVSKIVSAGRALVDQGADTIVLGCMSMGFMEVEQEVSESLGVPVVNPSRAALALTESLVRLGLRQSRKAYALPPKMQAGATLEELLLR